MRAGGSSNPPLRSIEFLHPTHPLHDTGKEKAVSGTENKSGGYNNENTTAFSSECTRAQISIYVYLKNHGRLFTVSPLRDRDAEGTEDSKRSRMCEPCNAVRISVNLSTTQTIKTSSSASSLDFDR